MLRILFLGDDGHHRPAERFKQLESSMAGRHVVLEYTRALNDLNSAKLAGYDCLLIYANHTKISPEQEKAIEALLLATVNKISHPVLNHVRRSYSTGGAVDDETIQAWRATFGLEDEGATTGRTNDGLEDD